MQKIILYLLLIIIAFPGAAEAQISIGSTNRQSASSAMLDMDTTIAGRHLGVLFPRIPLESPTDCTSISNPVDYLLVFSPYTANPSYAGLNYWFNKRWNRFLNQSELYDSISTRHIAQIVLFATQSNPETSPHLTDNNNKDPYKLRIDNVTFDSQNGYNKTNYEYIIQEDGLYEITCNVELAHNNTKRPSMQTFIQINDTNTVSDLVSDSPVIVFGSVLYVAELKKGIRVGGAVGLGSWNTDLFTVTHASLAIVKY
ncbi:MAG: hypothetical protein LBS88_00825 [Tannerellaceae bacterium]|jgi:hypothetical protein|nr:hypothetical protein [Tannerellaceae bacterium]